MALSHFVAFSAASTLYCASLSAALIVAYDQSPGQESLSSLPARNSNTETNPGSNQQVADDFVVQSAGLQITQLDLWFTYRDEVADEIDGMPPASQSMRLEIFDDTVGGDPGSLVYSAVFSFAPVSTGERNGFLSPNEIFFAEVMLGTPFMPDAGVRYWLSPMGTDDSVTWQWQLSSSDGERRSRLGSNGGPDWRRSSLLGNPLEGDFAFRLHAIPEPSILLLLGVIPVFVSLRRSRCS